MNATWQALLDHAGATLSPQGHVLFPGHDATRQSCPSGFITLLRRHCVLRVSGADASGFLQAQLTGDIQQMPEGGGMLTAWCNPKGRVITTLLSYRLQGEYLLLLPAALRDRVVKRLGMFILRSEVQLADHSDDMLLLGCAGGAVARSGAPLSAGMHGLSAARQGDRYILELPSRAPGRQLILAPPAGASGLWDELARKHRAADSRCWERLDIELAIPWLEDGTSEQFLPQELNLDQGTGLSFSKGCFPGQEIIARLRYRGQVKRRLYVAVSKNRGPASPGMRVLDTASGAAIGLIVNAVPDADLGHRLLAVINTEQAEAEDCCLEDGTHMGMMTLAWQAPAA